MEHWCPQTHQEIFPDAHLLLQHRDGGAILRLLNNAAGTLPQQHYLDIFAGAHVLQLKVVSLQGLCDDFFNGHLHGVCLLQVIPTPWCGVHSQGANWPARRSGFHCPLWCPSMLACFSLASIEQDPRRAVWHGIWP